MNKTKIFSTPYFRLILLVCVLSGLIIISSLPLFLKGIAENGHDLYFHLMRLETAFIDLKKGAFPVRINSSAISNYGYPVSSLYGDLYLYPFMIMRALGFTINAVFKSLLFTINLFTVVISYLCFCGISKNRNTSLIMTCAYVMSPYRLTDLYVRNAIGESVAAIALPIAALAVYRIYTGSPDRAEGKKASNLLALGLSILLCSHFLTFKMTVFILMIHALLFYRKTFTKDSLRIIFAAIGKTILLSAFFLIPYMDIVVSSPIRLTDTIYNTVRYIQDHGLFLSDLFMITHSEFADRYPLTPGLILILALLYAIVMAISGKTRKDTAVKYYIPVILVLLFASTRLFPWNYLSANSAAFNLISQIQFPFRLLMPATLYMTLLLGHMTDNYSDPAWLNKLTLIVLSFGLLTASLYTETYKKETSDSRVIYRDTADVDLRSVGGGEYLRSNTLVYTMDSFDKPDEYLRGENDGLVSSYTVEGTGMILECHGPDFPIDIYVPKYNYKGYHVYDEHGDEYETKDGLYDLLTFKLPAGYNGNVYVKYIEPWYWRAAEITSLVFLLYLFITALRSRAFIRKQNDQG